MDNSPVTPQKKSKKKVSKSGQQQASDPQLARPEPAGSQPIMEQQDAVPDDEPLLEASCPLFEAHSRGVPSYVGSASPCTKLSC